MRRTNLADLPDDVRAAIEPHMAQDATTLNQIGLVIGRLRDKAKAARTSIGIEETWRQAEDAYAGVDDANREEFQSTRWQKPMSSDGPVTTGRDPKGGEIKNTNFIGLTARYVDAGAAKLVEILLPADDKAFSFTETPVPELIKAKEDRSHVVHDGMGNIPLMRPLKPGEVIPLPAPGAPPATPSPMPSWAGGNVVPFPGTQPGAGSAPAPGAGAAPGGPPTVASPPTPPMVPLTVADLAEEAIEMARKKAKAAETRIYDWLVECQYTSEMRKVIFDSARLGVGVLKAPTPKIFRDMAVSKEGKNGVTLEIREKLQMVAKWVNPWDVFPDPTCGENIHNGDYIFERDFLSERQLMEEREKPGYIGSQIDKVIMEGPDKINVPSNDTIKTLDAKKGRYEVWYFCGTIPREDMDCLCTAAGQPYNKKGKPQKQAYAIVTLINDTAVRVTFNPLDSGSFPYHAVPWQRRTGYWAGKGVGEQLRTPQRMINSANRAMCDNAGKAAGSQFVVDMGSIRPMDEKWNATPDKFWRTTSAGEGRDVRQAFSVVQVPNTTEQLMKLIDFALQLAEESTSIPLVTQGQSGPTSPDTYGATQLQNSNANQLLRSIGYAFDDYVTEPMTRQFYEWLLVDPAVPDDEKGDFKINAHGSIALVERAIQQQAIAQMAPVVANPAFGMDPKKWMKQNLRAQKLNPDDFLYSPEQQAKIDSAPPTPAPAVQVAQIAASVARDKLVADQSSDQRTLQNESQIAAAAAALDGQRVQAEAGRVQAEDRRTATDATIKLHELHMKREIAMLEHANMRGLSLDQIKAELAKTAMTLNTQEKLNARDNAVEVRKHEMQRQAKSPKGAHPQRSTPALTPPPAQVPGRAAPGKAFEQGTK
jgi:hypothetical protein